MALMRSAQARESKRSAFGALFLFCCWVPPDEISLPPCSRPSRGFRGINGCPPRTAGKVPRFSTKAAPAPCAGPPIYSTIPLTAAPRGALRKASGRGTSFGRDVFAAPCGGVEQGTWGKKEAETICATCHLINMSTCLHIYVLAC